MRYRHTWEVRVIGVLLSLSLAILTTFVSDNLGERAATRADTIENQARLLRGEPFVFGDETLFIAPHYNRILIPLLLAAGSESGLLSAEGWYHLIRLATAFLAFWAFWWCSLRLTAAGLKGSLVGALLLGYGFIITFNYAIEYPIDFLEAAFFALFVLLSVRRRYFALLTVAILGSLNRESAAFTAILWGALHGIDERGRLRLYELLRALLLGIAAYGTALLVRVWVAGENAMQSTQWLSVPSAALLREMLHPFDTQNPLYLSLAFLLLAGIWLRVNRRFADPVMKRLLVAAVLIAVGSSVFGFFYELRIYLPAMTIAAMVVAGAENNASAAADAA